MKTYFSELIPKIQRYSQKLDEEALLINQHWTLFNEESNQRVVYIFRSNNELLISTNGNVEKANWEYLGNNSLLIDQKKKSLLFNHGFLNEQILALKIDGKNEYAILLNENKIQKKISTFNEIQKIFREDIEEKYFHNKINPPETSKPSKNNEDLLREDTWDPTSTGFFIIAMFIFVLFVIIMIMVESN